MPPPSTRPASPKRDVGSPSDANNERPIESEEDLTPRPDDWFEDKSAESQISFTYRNGQEARQTLILESLGGGVAMLDFDQDGDLDLFFTGGGTIKGKTAAIKGRPSALFRNDGSWKFTDVTHAMGLDVAGDYSHGCAVADFNRDGYPDLFVCCYGNSHLFQNVEGRQFKDVTGEAHLQADGWCTAAAWSDIDQDGYPDLFVTRYLTWSPKTARPCFHRDGQRDVCSPGDYPAAGDFLFHNRGDGTFEEISKSAGITRLGKGLGVVSADVNNDGWMDFYVANDECDNDLYLGGPGRTFQETSLRAGVATNEFGMHDGSMGVDAADLTGDGKLDLWVTNFEAEDNVLYQNLGNGLFTQISAKAGLAGQSRRQVGFGTALADFDGDGRLDIFVANGHVFYHGGQLPYLQRPQLFQNNAEGRFKNVSEVGGPYF
ncbi:MAG: VCBS repeat-containing protein, partial [Planctomycetaceae bacterium]|nr:VCBS repeat-containing protein [Planctomycetaceae bacterium]